MFRNVFTLGCLALGVWTTVPAALAQQGSGPIREGVRRTGEAVAEGTRAAARATGRAVERTGEAILNTAEGTADAARRLTGRDGQANDSRTYADESQPIDGQTTQNQAANMQDPNMANQQSHSAGYRGEQATLQSSPQAWNSGCVYTLRHDQSGREFICVSGQRVYFDSQVGQAAYQQQPTPAEQQPGNMNGQQPPAAPQPYEANRPISDENAASNNATGQNADQATGSQLGENPQQNAGDASSLQERASAVENRATGDLNAQPIESTVNQATGNTQ